jgi:hypothetical protein
VRANQRRFRDRHDPPPPKPTCQPGHKIVRVGKRHWACGTCRQERKRQKAKETWQRIKADPVRLEARRASGRVWARAKTERERALRPPEPSRELPDGTWRCIGCGQTKPPDAFYTRTATGQPEARCKVCSWARRQELRAAHRAGQDG